MESLSKLVEDALKVLNPDGRELGTRRPPPRAGCRPPITPRLSPDADRPSDS